LMLTTHQQKKQSTSSMSIQTHLSWKKVCGIQQKGFIELDVDFLIYRSSEMKKDLDKIKISTEDELINEFGVPRELPYYPLYINDKFLTRVTDEKYKSEEKNDTC